MREKSQPYTCNALSLPSMTAGSENPSSTRRYTNEKTPAGSRSIEEQAQDLPYNTARFSSAIPQTKLRYALTDAGYPISAAVRTAEETFFFFFFSFYSFFRACRTCGRQSRRGEVDRMRRQQFSLVTQISASA